MSNSNKRVTDYERYEYNGQEFVRVTVQDGWIYRFARAVDEEETPYTLDMKQTPSGNRTGRKNTIPQRVREFMEENFDAAQLDPEMNRGDGDYA